MKKAATHPAGNSLQDAANSLLVSINSLFGAIKFPVQISSQIRMVEGVPAHVLSSALYERFSSRGEADFADKLLSAMRYEFGGHVEKPPAKRAG